MSIRIYSDADDGYIQSDNTVNTTFNIQAGYLGSAGVTRRGVIYFAVPADSGYIVSAKLNLYAYRSTRAATTIEIHKFNGSKPPAGSDFSNYDSAVLGSFSMPANNAEGWYNNISFTPAIVDNMIKILLRAQNESDDLDRAFYSYNQGSNIPYIDIETRTTEAQNLGLVPVTDRTHVEVRGRYYCSDGLDSSKIRVQISDAANFSNILIDTGQVTKVVANNDDFSYIVEWFPSSAGTYYFRVAFWNSDIETQNPVWKSSSFTVGYPSIGDISYEHNKEEMYTFTAEVQDTYTKPPIVSLNVDSNSYLMELKSRTGAGPYTYLYEYTLPLERGKHRYYVNVGNVWTTLTSDSKILYANYKLTRKGIKIFAGERQINAWNITLTLPLLPDVPTVEFDTDEELGNGQITVQVRNIGIKQYRMDIASTTSKGTVNHVRAVSTIKNYLQETVTMTIKSADSYSVLQSITGRFPLFDDYSDILTEPITLWDIQNERRGNVIEKLLILNNACAYEENGHIIVKLNTSTTAKLKIGRHDSGVQWSADYQHIVNRIREYYKITHYPVPKTLFTDYDAANWTGATDIQQTTNGLSAPSNSPYLLKITDDGERDVDFVLTDYDYLQMSWCPEGGESLEIRLKTDNSNYYTYTKTFAGQRGAGFVLSGANSATDELSKTISASIKIASLTVFTAADVSVKVTLKKSGADVYESAYIDTSDKKAYFSFPNYDIDTIVLTFTNLSVIGTSYGVTVNQLAIQKYYSVYEVTGTKKEIVYQHVFDGYHSFGSKVVLYNTGSMQYHVNKEITIGSIPPNNAGQTLAISGYAQVWKNVLDSSGAIKESESVNLPVTFYRNSNNQLVAKINTTLYPNNYWYETDYYINKVLVHANVKVEKITTYGQYVWKYGAYPWNETYNLFETFRIPLEKFDKVGSPSTQINSIELIATGVQNFDEIFVANNTPRVYYVEVKSDDWTQENDRFQERKLDDMHSYENAKAFAEGLITIYKDPVISYEKTMPFPADIELGDFYNADGQILHVYQITVNNGKMHIQIGRSVQDTIQYLKETHNKLKALEKNIM